MRNMIKGLGIAVVSGATILSTSLAADNWCWDNCCWDGCWEIGGEALYWKTCGLEWEFGNRSVNANTENRRLTLKQDYEWGFRIFGSYYSCSGCAFLKLDWVHLRPSDLSYQSQPLSVRATFNGDSNVVSLNSGGFKESTRYDRVNLRGGYYLFKGCDISFHMFGGIRWLELNARRKVGATQTGGTGFENNERSRYWGLGLEVGIGSEYHIGCGFNLAGCAAGTTALGERRYSYTTSSDGTTVDRTTAKTRTQCVPGVDFRLGINYTYDCACVSLKGEIGYELNYYYDAIAFRKSGTTPIEMECLNVGFAGPYISLSLCF